MALLSFCGSTLLPVRLTVYRISMAVLPPPGPVIGGHSKIGNDSGNNSGNISGKIGNSGRRLTSRRAPHLLRMGSPQAGMEIPGNISGKTVHPLSWSANPDHT